MSTLRILVVGLLLLSLVGASGVAAAEPRACPDVNPGQGLAASTDASDGTSLERAGPGINRALEGVGCPPLVVE